jgi:8-oxo-dGTP diphosphatase
MEPPADGEEDGSFVPNDEVDELRWYTVPEASERLTYSHDRELLEKAEVPG